MRANKIFIIFLYSCIFDQIDSADVFDSVNCRKGCRLSDGKCSKNAHCVPILSNSNCGMCLCDDGFTPAGNKCKASGHTEGRPKTTAGPRSRAVATTRVSKEERRPHKAGRQKTPPPSQVVNTPAPQSKNSAGSVPKPEPIVCSQYQCGPQPQPGIDENPLKIRSQKMPSDSSVGCKNKVLNERVSCKSPIVGNAVVCNGVHCLDTGNGKSYCVCPYDKIGDGCNEDKPGDCSLATGQVPDYGYISTDKRFHHDTRPDSGDVMARHLALNLEDCIKLCQWTQAKCRSVNFGAVNGQNVCELLSVQVYKGSLLSPWVKPEPGWTYACCFK